MNAWVTAAAAVGGLVLAATGIVLAVASDGGAPVQATQLLHVATGWVLLVPLVWATLRHRRVRGNQGSGLMAGALLAVVLGSGVAQSLVAFAGVAGPVWLLQIHLWSTVGLVALTAVHVLAAVKRRPAARWTRRWAGPAVIGTAIAVASTVGVGMWLDGVQAAPSPQGYGQPFGDSPFAPALTKVVGGGFVAPHDLAGSIRCRSCHEDIYEQWSESMHRYAATDPHVETGIRWFQRDNGVAAGRVCAGCHNPVGLLAGWYGEANSPPDVGTPAHDEGISCLSCHAITGIGEDPLGNGSYHITPPSMPAAGGWLGDLAIHLDVQAHKRAMMSPVMQSPKLCGTCHQQFFSAELGGEGPSKMLNQYPEWQASHYADPSSPQHKTCNDCHMPRVPSDDPAATGGKIRSHRFLGANHAHAVASGHETQAEATLALLREGVTMEVAEAKQQDRPDHLAVEVRVTNAGAGHRFPSGTTDISETWIEVVAGDSGDPIWTSGLLDDKHYLDPEAHVWRTVYVDANNVPVDLHNLAVVHRTTEDGYIAPGETDVARFYVPLAGRRDGALPVRVRLRMRKTNQRWNDWLTNFDGTTVPVTDIHEQTLTVDLASVAIPAGAPKEPGPTPLGEQKPAPSGMVHVPAGPAIIGSEEGDPDERPVHTVTLSGFYIDRFPVTNSQYQAFVRATGRRGPIHRIDWAQAYNWRGQDFPEGTADRPVVLVNRQEAEAYCQWRGKRLPTEAEWEKAARGPNGRRFPWGDTWDEGACAAVEGLDIPPRVGMCPQRASPYGAQELVGGVYEWVQDFYRAYDRTFLHPNANEWITTFGDPSYVLRGVPAGQAGPATTAAARSGHADNMRAKIGFRCAQDGP